jgi:hypothetical protein
MPPLQRPDIAEQKTRFRKNAGQIQTDLKQRRRHKRKDQDNLDSIAIPGQAADRGCAGAALAFISASAKPCAF